MVARIKSWFTGLDESRGWKAYLLPFTLVFIVMMAVMSFSLLVAGKGFIWDVDGLSQQYVFTAYEGMWLRELFANVFTGQDLPLWTSQIGWGGDPFVTMLSCIGDPMNALSALIPTQAVDIALNLSVPVRLYLAGVLFSGFCFYKGKTRFATLIASMVYLFGGFTTIAFTQIFMLYELILAPLIIWGAEKLIARESPVLFIVAMGLSFLSGLTFGYATCLLLVVYCVVRFIFLPTQKSAKLFFTLFFRFVGCILLGVAIGAITLFPSAFAILSQGRIGLERPDELLYNINYYVELLQGFVGLADVGADCSYGFAAIALICVFMLFCQKPAQYSSAAEVKVLRTLFVAMFLFLCLPMVGRMFNGFAYANNRWVWAFVLLVAYIVAAMLPSCLAVKRPQSRKLFRYAVIFALLIVFVLFPFLTRNALFGLIMVFAVLALLIGALGLSKVARQAGTLLSVVIGAAFLFNSYASQFVDNGSLWSSNMAGLGRSYKLVVEGDPTSVLKQIEDDELWRYDVANMDQILNGNLVQDLNALRFYSSYYNQWIDDFQTGLGLRTSSMNFMYTGLDSRAQLESLAGVRYLVSKAGSDALIPQTFQTTAEDVEVANKVYDYAESDYDLPLIYVQNKAISSEQYAALTPIQKQEALLQGAVLDASDDSNALPQAQITYSQQPRESQLCYVDSTPIQANDGREDATGIAFDGTSFKVNAGGAKVLLQTYASADADTYVYVPHYSFENLLPSERYTEAAWNDTPLYKKERVIFDDAFFGKGVYDSKVFFEMNGIKKELWSPTQASHLYSGKEEWVINMGHLTDPALLAQANDEGLVPVTIELTFQNPGIYSLGDISVIAQPAQQAMGEVSALKEKAARTVSNVQVTGSSLACDVAVEDPSALIYLSVPFSSGWSATLDGEPVDIQHANVGFMGVIAEAGEHHLELHYATPGLVPGAILSLIGWVSLAGVVLIRRRIGAYPEKGHQ